MKNNYDKLIKTIEKQNLLIEEEIRELKRFSKQSPLYIPPKVHVEERQNIVLPRRRQHKHVCVPQEPIHIEVKCDHQKKHPSKVKEKIVEVPVERIVEKIVEKPVTKYVEKFLPPQIIEKVS